MKVPPKKPHFFKPILQPGFKEGLNIPIGFLKYLKGEEPEHAVLRRGGKKWLVKLKGPRFKAGWAEFAEEHDLQLGDLLVFRHEGNMEFDVTIFDSSHCDIEYAEYLQQQQEQTSKKFDFKEEEEEDNDEEGEGGGGGGIEEEEEEEYDFKEVAIHYPIGQSHLECTVRTYCLSKGYLRLPQPFARANGFIDRNCGLIIIDERQRSWNLRLNTHRSQVYVLGGWGEFRAANDLKKGDNMMFEVVTNGEKPLWKFHDKRNPSTVTSRQTSPNEESASLCPFSKSHCVFTVKSSCLSSGYLFLPKKFALANGFMNKKFRLVIRDERQRSWNLMLATCTSRVCIRGGWSEFHVANDLKVGDRVTFEVVTRGKKPIWKFHVKRKPSINSLSNGLPYAEAATGESHFVCTVKPYCLSSDLLYIPKRFARANGLTNKKCDLIIRDERQRSWNVRLSSFGTDVCIRGGWHEFREANCLKEGDCIRFEVVINGNKPIWKFNACSLGITSVDGEQLQSSE